MNVPTLTRTRQTRRTSGFGINTQPRIPRPVETCLPVEIEASIEFFLTPHNAYPTVLDPHTSRNDESAFSNFLEPRSEPSFTGKEAAVLGIGP